MSLVGRKGAEINYPSGKLCGDSRSCLGHDEGLEGTWPAVPKGKGNFLFLFLYHGESSIPRDLACVPGVIRPKDTKSKPSCNSRLSWGWGRLAGLAAVIGRKKAWPQQVLSTILD